MPKHGRTTLAALRWLGAPAILLLPAVAHAHTGGDDTGLINGLMHPVFGPDHLLAMISVGVVSAQLGGHNIWRIPLAFVAAMTVGGALGILQFTVLNVELGIAASVVVLGIGIVFAHRGMSPWPITALVLMFGACHGHAHGLEIPKSATPALYTLGFVISTSVLHVFGVIIGEVAAMQTWLWRGLRVTGAAVSTAGVAFLLNTLGATV
jgi:urease accessory protein